MSIKNNDYYTVVNDNNTILNEEPNVNNKLGKVHNVCNKVFNAFIIAMMVIGFWVLGACIFCFLTLPFII